MATNTIFITGAGGQLGSELKDLAATLTGWDMRFFDRSAFPLEDEARAREIFEAGRPAFFLNCAAYTAVDKAESEPDAADEINGYAPGRIASLCNHYGAKLIHISTDYVFNGKGTSPMKVTDPVEPVNRYGAGKLLGEKLVIERDPTAIIIRTSWVYSHHGKNFVKTMIRLQAEKESIGVVADQTGSPTYAADLAEAMMTIVSSGKWVPGIYHYSNQGIISWFDFASAIRDLTGSRCEVKPITTEQFPTPAKRPSYSGMDLSRIEEVYGIKPPGWKESLVRCLERLHALA